MIGDFTDWAKDQREDIAGLMASIELEQFGSDPIDGIYIRLEEILNDANRMVEDAAIHDQELDEDLVDQGVGNTLARRLEGVVRDLEFDDPDNLLLIPIDDAVRDYYNNVNDPDLIVVARVA